MFGYCINRDGDGGGASETESLLKKLIVRRSSQIFQKLSWVEL